MPSKRDKTTGLPLPDPVVPPDNLCVRLYIPNDPLYVQAFRGVLSELGKNWTWRQTVGQDNNAAYEAAEMWRDRLQYITVTEDCEDPVSCADITNCIETNGGTRDSITQLTMQYVPMPNDYPMGTTNPTPNADIAADTNPTCDPDITWSQCLAIVEKTHSSITDVLEKIEAATNSVELADALSEFPVVGWAKDIAGVQAAIDLSLYYQEALAEQYAAQYSDSVRDQIACELFCLCKDDCTVTLERVYQVMKTRVETYLTVPTLDDMLQLIDFLAGVDQDTTLVVDLAFFAAWGMAKLGSFFFGPVYDKTFELIVALAVNDANDDWILLCEDCAPVETRTPVIAAYWDAGIAVGTLSGPDIDGLYTVTAANRPTDQAFSIEDIAGREFVLTDVVYSDTPACQIWGTGNTITHFECGTGNQYTNQTIDVLSSTHTLGGTFTMQFKMVAP